jgi:hypothetical protein
MCVNEVSSYVSYINTALNRKTCQTRAAPDDPQEKWQLANMPNKSPNSITTVAVSATTEIDFIG